MSGAEIAIAGIVLSAAATTVAPSFAELVKKKITEKKKSLADLHDVLEKGLKELLAIQSEKDTEVLRNQKEKDPSEPYKFWKTRVSDIEKTVNDLNEEYKQEKEKKGSHTKKRAYDKNEIKRALNEVIELLGKCKDMNVLVDKLLERVKKECDAPPIADYLTLEKAFQDVRSLQQNDKVKCVALYGQKGVGKTTIMQHLNNHHFNDSSDNKEFDMVIFVKVAAAEQTDVRTEYLHIKRKIAERMMENTKAKELQDAESIQGELKNKRYLLILDGIRYALALDRILGMLDISEDKKDSKVVITTHYPLAWKSKYVDRKVELEPLSHDEALRMFRNITGDNHLPDKGLTQVVCKKFCCRLPLLIDRIATSFKYQEAPIDWQRAVNECTPWPQVAHWQRDLNEGTFGPGVGDDDLRDLYSNLEISFRMLGDQSKQKCFLYASLYPANSNICTHYLVECYIVQGFLGDVDADTKYSEMRSRAKDVILRHLVNVAFLEEGEQMSYVKMTDLYRQFALYISHKDPNLECRIYVDKEEHKEAFRSTSWKDAKWVSMIDSKRKSLPTRQDYGSLQTLLLQKNTKLLEIPTTYFDGMDNLLVLNLSGTEIKKLPSLLRLTNLKAFYLNDCLAFDMSQSNIQRLQLLEVFDSQGTQVDLDFVPNLENLRCLRISYITNYIYHGISKLHKLEELTIEGCNKMLNVNAINNTPENAGLSSDLEQLHLDNLQHPLHGGSVFTLHTLTLKNSSIVFSLAVDDFPELQNLIVQNCSRIEVLIKVTEGGQSIVSKLKMLILDNLSDIKSICSNENLAWSSLEKLRVRKCPELRRLPFNKTKATNLSTIEGEEEWWSNLVLTGEDRKQLQSAFSAFA